MRSHDDLTALTLDVPPRGTRKAVLSVLAAGSVTIASAFVMMLAA
ncbi:hypothetical protein [Psychromarinibacter halotolerans]|uniref:Uncharacterized protein n=1 Tax=Psychromarinibacter halotolerans TaxID=1775175 RepID=A0ABV7GNF6_9RHOB|nr:hypothetical protein [Psychromarinibacter halotolerans]MDF0595521.1 hypothetical protein [Psychromarinibacter halotolerans]